MSALIRYHSLYIGTLRQYSLLDFRTEQALPGPVLASARPTGMESRLRLTDSSRHTLPAAVEFLMTLSESAARPLTVPNHLWRLRLSGGGTSVVPGGGRRCKETDSLPL